MHTTSSYNKIWSSLNILYYYIIKKSKGPCNDQFYVVNYLKRYISHNAISAGNCPLPPMRSFEDNGLLCGTLISWLIDQLICINLNTESWSYYICKLDISLPFIRLTLVAMDLISCCMVNFLASMSFLYFTILPSCNYYIIIIVIYMHEAVVNCSKIKYYSLNMLLWNYCQQ